MRTRALLLLLAAVVSPAFAATQVTVEQLESVLSTAQGTPDAEVARQLAELALSERLSAAKLSRWQTQFAGLESRQALTALADSSAFLALPPAEVPAKPAPDVSTQRQLLSLTVNYVLKTIHQLPNLSTIRVTNSFQSSPWAPEKGQTEPRNHQPLRLIGSYNASVFYRDGQEVVHASTVQTGASAQGLTTTGEFGPILNTVLLDAARSKLAWGHWEQGAGGLEAVFHYAVPPDKSHYEVKYCCIWRQNGDRVYFQQFSGYQGEIAVDPSNGTILRLTLMADLKPTDPLIKAGILVEYGPVVIAGRTYICPVRSVALSVGLEIEAQWQGSVNSLGLLQTSLNDSVFEQYHVFRAEARVLSADGGEPDASAAARRGAEVAQAMSISPRTQAVADPPAAEPSLANSLAAPPLAVAAPPALAAPSASTAAVTVPPAANVLRPAAPTVPEISVGEADGLPPEPSTTPSFAHRPQTTLRVTTHLVDVGVMATDNKGRPVTNLTADDFAIYDNGRKQLTQLAKQAAADPAKAAGPLTAQPLFANSRASAGSTHAATVQSNLTVVLMDPANMAWADLSYAREQILRSLRTLPADERVALYIARPPAFQVLEEGTSDRALLAGKLRQWVPSAQELAQAQQAEEHTRQHFDEVANTSDLQFVNGRNGSAPESSGTVDLKLRGGSGGESREAQALAVLINMARYLAAMPGHKNVVWVASDNVLADWSDKAVGKDKGSKHADGLALSAQEALNDAHISLYPLDASQLETQAVDAGLENKSIGVAPGAAEAPAVQGGADKTGRVTAEMQQDLHMPAPPIEGLAAATGGHVFRRAADIAAELQQIVADSRSMYLLSFTPDTPADDQYHHLAVKLTTRRGVTLHYRTGYQYVATPLTRQDRFRQAIWQPVDVDEVAVSATPLSTATGSKLVLNIATADLALTQENERWTDRLGIFLVERDEAGLHAKVTGQTLSLALKAATLQELTEKGISFEQAIGAMKDATQAVRSVRVVVVDENSGLMGSVTVPASALGTKP